MPYVNRDEAGKIISMHQSRTSKTCQWLEADNSELQHFIRQQEPDRDDSDLVATKLELNSTDFELIRVIEDVVDLLIEKKLIMFTDLPKSAQQKLGARKKLRQNLDSLENLINDDDNIFTLHDQN